MQIFLTYYKGWTLEKTDQWRKAGTKIRMRLPDKFLELVSVFKEANRNVIYFSLKQVRLKMFKKISHVQNILI
jgi:hypothetical protein